MIVATIFKPTGGKALIYVLNDNKWKWVMTYDYHTGEVRQYIPRESI